MWPVQIEMCYECRIHANFEDSVCQENLSYLINNFFFNSLGVKPAFYLFIYFWLCWVFVSVRGPSLVAASGATLHRGARAFHRRGLSCCGAQAPDTQAQ